MKISRDKIKHFTACFIVAFLTALIEAALGAEYHYSWLAGFVAGIAIGVGKEYGDKCAVGNRWDWSDIVADSFGAVAGASVGSLVSIFKS